MQTSTIATSIGLVLAVSSAGPSSGQNNSVPLGDETAVFAALAEHLAEYAEIIQSGRYVDGSEMGPICEQFGYNVCASEAFLGAHDAGETVTAGQYVANGNRLLVDVRGPTDRGWAVLGDASNAAVTYGVDGYDPVSISELDREAFAETVYEAVGDQTKPIAVICSLGVRSRAAAMALREAGFTDVVNIADGVLGNPAGDGLAVALGIPVNMPEQTQTD